MNWKLIFQLSLFGLFMGLATVFFIPSQVEPFCWLAIFLFCAWTIARAVSGGALRLLHGVCLGIANSIWITACHILLVNRYLVSHAQEKAMMRQLPMHSHPRLSMLFVGALVGVFSGCIIGLFSVLASLLFKKSDDAAKAMGQSA